VKFKIIGSGSTGNCFLINEDLMIDIGLDYTTIKPCMGKVKYLLLTHKHSDHLNLTALRKLYVAVNPVVICGEWLVEDIKLFNPTIVETGKVYTFVDYKISPIQLYHDVLNCGYRIMQNGHKHLHITDTATLEGIKAYGYDTASIECNHDENKALELIRKARKEGEFTHLTGAMNSHLSVQQTIKFCEENNIKKLIPVHIGNSTRDEVIQALRNWNENLI
jgi:phosphoribosyl 1,2-cyclic phosphodiesterase